MANFQIGLSALRSTRFALDVFANNIANANTEGYHLRRVNLQSAPPNLVEGVRIGNGVSISNIRRIRDTVTESALTTVISDFQHVDQAIIIGRKIESAILNGDNSVGHQLDQFFTEFTALSSAPGEPAQRSALIASATQLTEAIRSADSQLTDLKRTIRQQIENELEAINQDMGELSRLSSDIRQYSLQGSEHNNELDQRDAVINRVAELLGISRYEDADGILHLTVGSHSIQQGSVANEFRAVESDGKIEVFLDTADAPLPLTSGRLAALIEYHNEIIPSFEADLDQLSSKLINRVNQIHATGIGTEGPFSNLVGNVSLDQSNVPLQEAFPDLQLSSGDLTVTLHDASGNRTTHVIAIDPTADTLDDLAARLSTISDLAASVQPVTNRLQLSSSPDMRFDFTGGVETQPDLSLVTGTSVATLSGVYNQRVNDTMTVRIEGTGTVGRDSPLYANVYSGSGALIEQINLGEGYEAGSEVELDNGVRLQFEVGTLNDGDEFSTRLAGDPDETGVLAALGLNAFFQGTDAFSIEVDEQIIRSPNRIASGRTGESSDSSNLDELIALTEEEMMPNDRTMAQFVSEMATEIGFDIESNQTLSISLTSYKLRLEQERDGISGVDLNEELVYLQEFQKAYEASIRVIQAMDNVLNEIFRIID